MLFCSFHAWFGQWILILGIRWWIDDRPLFETVLSRKVYVYVLFRYAVWGLVTIRWIIVLIWRSRISFIFADSTHYLANKSSGTFKYSELRLHVPRDGISQCCARPEGSWMMSAAWGSIIKQSQIKISIVIKGSTHSGGRWSYYLTHWYNISTELLNICNTSGKMCKHVKNEVKYIFTRKSLLILKENVMTFFYL